MQRIKVASAGAAGAWLITTALVSVFMTSPAMGQNGSIVGSKTATAQKQFNIQPQSLQNALALFGQQAGMQVSVNAATARSLSSPGVSGRLTPQAAIAKILEGTGLPYRFSGLTTVVVGSSGGSSDASSADTTMLAPIVVAAQGATTEGTGSYTTSEMSTATGLNLSIKETPQSVSVVSSARMRDNGMTTVEDALEKTTGITVSATGGERSNYFSRGFQVDNIMIDGVPVSHDSDTLGSASLAMYDRVEVVRGSTGLLEGAGNPSASINLVRKRPTDERQISVTGSVGSWADYMGILDAGGPLNSDGSFRGRFVSSLQDANTYTKDYEHKRQLYYGVLEADVTDNTMLTFGGYYNSERNPGADWNGLPARPDGSFYDFDRSVRSSPSWTYWDKENINVFGEVKHQFDNDWELHLKGTYLDTKLDMLGASLYRLDPAADELQYNIGKYFYHHKQMALDANLKGDFAAFGRTHEFSVGANYRKNKGDDGPGGWPSSFPYQFDPLNWEQSISAPYPEFNYLWSLKSENINYGIYATTKLSITDPLNVFIGGRLSWSETETFYRSGTYEESTAFNAKGKFTPYIAATFDITNELTVYGSITDIFKPQTGQTTGGGFLDPVEGTNYEVGLKGEFLDGRLNASVAVFQIDQMNLPQEVAGGCGGIDCYTASGKVRSRGFEVEVSGEVATDWNVFAGYTYVDSRSMEDSTSGAAGTRFGRDLPQNILTLSTIYTLPGELEDWRIGASARIQSKIEGDVAGVTTTKQGGFGTLDLMAAYNPNERTEFRFNVYNVFDRYYYKSVGYTDNANILGAPRSFMLTGTYKF